MPVGGQFQEKFFQESSSEKSPEIDPAIRLEETRSSSDDRVLRAFISEGWHPIELPQPGEVVDVTRGTRVDIAHLLRRWGTSVDQWN